MVDGKNGNGKMSKLTTLKLQYNMSKVFFKNGRISESEFIEKYHKLKQSQSDYLSNYNGVIDINDLKWDNVDDVILIVNTKQVGLVLLMGEILQLQPLK